MNRFSVIVTSLLLNTTIPLPLVHIAHAEMPNPTARFFVYEKDGHCQLENAHPKQWLPLNGAGWVLVTCHKDREGAIDAANKKGCQLTSP